MNFDVAEGIREMALFFSEPSDLDFDTDEVADFAKCVLKYLEEVPIEPPLS